MSFVASGVRSVRVSNGASRLRNSSVLLGFDLARFRPSCKLVFIAKHSTSFAGNIARLQGRCIAENEKTLHPSFRVQMGFPRSSHRAACVRQKCFPLDGGGAMSFRLLDAATEAGAR